MKKNVMMRLASFLLVAVLISTSAISGTYAKYVTEGSSFDNARVAKWGVSVSANYSEFFKDTYTSATAYNDGISVEADVDVVAPGTDGNLADFVVTGTPEVDVEVTYTAKLKLENWNIASGEYCPIIFNVNGDLFYIGKGTITDVASLVDEVQKAIVASTEKYDAGTDLSTVVADDLSVSWMWQFDNTSADFKSANDQTDVKDTELGNRFAKGEAMGTIELDVKCTITQID